MTLDMTPSQISSLAAISTIFSVFSVIGSTFIIVCYFKFKKLRKFAFTLVCILSVNDFFNQIGDFATPGPSELENDAGDPSGVCLFQAWTDSYFETSSVLWTSAIAMTLYLSVHRRKGMNYIKRAFKWYCLVCIGFPLLVAVIPGAAGMYGHAGGWCWITDDYPEWRFIQFYIPVWVCIAFNGWVYYIVIRQIGRTMRAGGESAAEGMRPMMRIVRRLRFYPLILVIVWFWATINRLVEAFGGESVFWLAVLHKTFSSMQGLLNALAYGFTGGVREEVAKELPAYCCPSSHVPYARDGGAEGETGDEDSDDDDPDEGVGMPRTGSTSTPNPVVAGGAV